MKRITINDVATAAGVSIKTVSRVLNREPNVRPSVRAKVEAAVQSLGYVPNSAARSLAGARSFLIGAIFDNPSDSYIVAIQRGAMAACRDAGYHLTIEEIDSAHQVADQMRRLLTNSRLDGAILSPPVTDNPAVLDALEEKRVRYVRLMPARFPHRSPAILVDDAAAAAEVARHLWQLGHRRLGMITGPHRHGASALRRNGFLKGIVAAGGMEDAVRMEPGDFSFRAGQRAARKLLASSPRPTAIFAGNDEMAAGTYAAAAELGLNIPRDLAVVGYDDSAVAELLWPPLTTVRQPISDMAAEAARLLIAGDAVNSASTATLDYQFIIRQSTAPA